MAGPFIGCAICGHEETHDPICELHECEDCGEHGEHHCVMMCDVIDCETCAAIERERAPHGSTEAC